MAAIAPFRGIRLSQKAGDPASFLRPEPDRGGELYRRRLGEGALVRDAQAAIYRYHQVFAHGGKETLRRSFIARLRLAATDVVAIAAAAPAGVAQVDEAGLMRAARAQFSLPLGLFDDRDRRTDALFEEVEKSPPDMAFGTPDGVTHRLWRLTDVDAQRRLVDCLSDKRVHVADGREPFAAMLGLSAELRPQSSSPLTAAAWGAMCFCSFEDPGLAILPAHRVLSGLPRFDPGDLAKRATEFFRILQGPRASASVMRQALAGHVKRGPTLAMLTPATSTVTYFRLRGDLKKESVPALAASTALGDLDVTLLHSLIFENLLGVGVGGKVRVTFVRDWDQAVAQAGVPGVQAVFLLNPATPEQLRAVGDEGRALPEQAAIFPPGIPFSLVINPLDPAEEVEEVAPL